MRGCSARKDTGPRMLAAQIAGWVAILLLMAAGRVGASEQDPILLSPTRYEILAGRYSVFADFQAGLQRLLDACGKPEPAVVPAGQRPNGRLGDSTRQAIQRALQCDAMRAVPPESLARDGLLTEAVWRAVMGEEPPPSVDARANAMVLSFEATDFGDAPEWNLCQDGQRGRVGRVGQKTSNFVCYNASDPCSFFTWGPRGATAGAGREIQYILWMAWKEDPALLQKAFGTEYADLHRFFHLAGGGKETCDGAIPLKQFVCSVWIDPERRRIWDEALATLGHSALVRNAYSRLYGLNEFDGAKLQRYFQLWRDLGLVPSQVDYAFFLDRATHLGGPPQDHSEVEKLAACLHEERRIALTANGAARRCLARQQPHETQPVYRLARDVGYYLDNYPLGALNDEEIRTWGGYVPISAGHNFRLSDVVPFHLTEAQSLTSIVPDAPKPQSDELTPAEMNACPASVLSPLHRKPN